MNIRMAINDLLENLPSTGAISFLESQGVTFGTQKHVGIGDIDSELYFNTEWCDFFFEGIFGVRWPSGIKVTDPGRLLGIFSTGNNRHYEVKFGGIGTYDPRVWAHIRAEAFYSYVIPRNERVAAPFAGATVKNIGPAINAKISWHKFVAHLDGIFLVPCNPRVGFLAGYEVYVKSKDNISLRQTTAVDFLGNTRPLDADVLQMRTDVVSHKVRTEMFHQGDFWELFGGWTHVFAGKNAPKESDWHIGFVAYF
jgi:hypothetical protein